MSKPVSDPPVELEKATAGLKAATTEEEVAVMDEWKAELIRRSLLPVTLFIIDFHTTFTPRHFLCGVSAVLCWHGGGNGQGFRQLVECMARCSYPITYLHSDALADTQDEGSVY